MGDSQPVGSPIIMAPIVHSLFLINKPLFPTASRQQFGFMNSENPAHQLPVIHQTLPGLFVQVVTKIWPGQSYWRDGTPKSKKEGKGKVAREQCEDGKL